MKKLHWGSGPKTPYGWINSDLHPFPGVQVVGDVLAGLPFPANEFDLIVSIHVLPELPFQRLGDTLRELYRVLCPGGILRLSLPDMDKAINAYRSGDVDYFFLIGDEMVQSLSGKMITQLLWHGQSRSLFTFDFTRELLERSGFVNIQACQFRETKSSHIGICELDDRELESFFVEASKPQ